MKPAPSDKHAYQAPLLLKQATEIDIYLKRLTSAMLQKSMKLSVGLATKTHELIQNWNTERANQTPAMDAFRGDIYSGLQARSFNQRERDYANQHLYILSGLYGILRALDSICPYRLEMAYKFPHKPFVNMYNYWQGSIADHLPKGELIINLAADEYSKTVLPFVDSKRVVSPKFMTISPKTGEPKFIAVHAKVARGAFANWLIKTRKTKSAELSDFEEIGYAYSNQLSTKEVPAFVCKDFGGKGLSVKLLDR